MCGVRVAEAVDSSMGEILGFSGHIIQGPNQGKSIGVYSDSRSHMLRLEIQRQHHENLDPWVGSRSGPPNIVSFVNETIRAINEGLVIDYEGEQIMVIVTDNSPSDHDPSEVIGSSVSIELARGVDIVDRALPKLSFTVKDLCSFIKEILEGLQLVGFGITSENEFMY